ncbi:MAG: RIP metalloprotease RseP [Candidatus Velthaea sp.]
MTQHLALALPSFAGIAKLLVFLVMLSVLVVLHEYGHFIIARRNGVRVNDFALGMGPTLLKWTSPRSGTNYKICAFPVGGYCAMKGEDGKTNEAEQQRAFQTQAGQLHDEDNFQAKTPLQRLAIVVAGPISNFIVAFALLFFGALIFGLPSETPTTRIMQLQPGYPAEAAGMHVGDRITAIDGKPVADGSVLVSVIHGSLGKRLHITYDRAGTQLQADIVPKAGKDSRTGKAIGLIGFLPSAEFRRAGPIQAVQASWYQFSDVIQNTLGALGGLVIHPQVTAGQLQGPIGMARVSATVQDFGWAAYVSLAATLSISLGIFNLLPIPALDGGRGVFILFEMLRGKPVDPEKEALVHVGGMALLLGLMLFVSYHDIAKLVAGKGAF